MKWTHGVLLALLSLALSAPGFAQWSKRLDPAVPRTRDGKLDLAARPPKTRDGKVDLSGVWRPLPDPLGQDHPDASGDPYPLRGEQHFPANLSGWPSTPERSGPEMDGLFGRTVGRRCASC